MAILNDIKALIHDTIDIRAHIDTAKAEEGIRNNIFFKGPNIWILVCAIVLASVGLNVNSTAVIIGAMLVSPLMGPIFGVGLGLGINDTMLIKAAIKNLLVMVVISLIAATLYFLLTPLQLANPTELLARTNPTIYDVMIALFGGLAGIFELSRKEKGTVISGVAIATALMPPLCTAGYGIASASLTYFLGAMYLFSINCIFIILATYLMVKYLHFAEIHYQDKAKAKKVRNIISIVVILVIVPSIWSAFQMIRENKFSLNVNEFVEENKNLDNGYIYDCKVTSRKGGSIEVFIAGEPLSETEKDRLLASAERHGIHEDQITFTQRALAETSDDASEKIVKGIYERTDAEIMKREERIRDLENQLMRYQQSEIPYAQLAREIRSQYPEVKTLTIARGAEIPADSLTVKTGYVVVAQSSRPLPEGTVTRLANWLKIRLGEDTVEVFNQTGE